MEEREAEGKADSESEAHMAERDVEGKADGETQAVLSANSKKAKCYIWTYCQLLWRIVSSQSFSDHIETLKMSWPEITVMHPPRHDYTDFYLRWVNYESLIEPKVKLDKDKDDSDESDLEEELDRDEDDDSTWEIKHVEKFKSLMHLNISHFTALNILIIEFLEFSGPEI
jgi:hypothetical protein